MNEEENSPNAVEPQTPEQQKKELPDNALGKFFADPDRPIWQKGLAGFTAFLLLFLLLQFLKAPAGPSGGATDSKLLSDFRNAEGIASDADAKSDAVAALTIEQKEKLAKRKERAPLELTREDPAESTSPESTSDKTPFTEFFKLGKAHSVFSRKGDSTLLLSKRVLLELGNETNTKLLSPQIYDIEFEQDLPDLSAAFASDSGDIWVATYDGLLLKKKRYEWKKVGNTAGRPRSRVRAITEFSGNLYLASNGIWKLDEAEDQLVPSAKVGTEPVFALSATDESLYAAGSSGVWQLNGGRWLRIWEPVENDRAAYSMAVKKDGTVLIGTADGLLTLSPDKILSNRALSGEKILAIQSGENASLWVGTDRGGLRYFDGDYWYGTKDELPKTQGGRASSVYALNLDASSRLWMRTGRMFSAAASEAEKWIKRFPLSSSQFSSPQFYSSACKAAETLLGDTSSSKQVSSQTYDGVRTVFFDGEKVCPQGFGHRRIDGATAFLVYGSWNIRTFIESRRERFELPKSFPADQTSAFFLDAADGLWAGASSGELQYHPGDNSGSWKDLTELAKTRNSEITAIAQDISGSLWLSARPPFVRSRRQYVGETLFRRSDPGDWSSFGTQSGISHWLGNDVLAEPAGNIFLAGGAGFSRITADGSVYSLGRKKYYEPDYSESISVDTEGMVWTTHGLRAEGFSWFDGRKVYQILEVPGAKENRAVAIAHDEQARVWVKAADGSTAVYPRRFLFELAEVIELPEEKWVTLSD